MFQIFDVAPYGVPYAIWGFLFVLLTQKFLLPGNSSKFAQVGLHRHTYGRRRRLHLNT